VRPLKGDAVSGLDPPAARFDVSDVPPTLCVMGTFDHARSSRTSGGTRDRGSEPRTRRGICVPATLRKRKSIVEM